jgi:hypothetical protein
MADIIQNAYDTAANWTLYNPVFAKGMFGYESDTDKFKVFDGVSAWNDLNYGAAVDLSGYVTQIAFEQANGISPTAWSEVLELDLLASSSAVAAGFVPRTGGLQGQRLVSTGSDAVYTYGQNYVLLPWDGFTPDRTGTSIAIGGGAKFGLDIVGSGFNNLPATARLSLETGTASGGSAAGRLNTNLYLGQINLDDWSHFEIEQIVHIPVLSNGTDTFSYSQGLTVQSDGPQIRTSGNSVCLSIDGSVLSLRSRASSTDTVATATQTIAANTWYRLKMTFDGTSLKGYVDGVLFATVTTGLPALSGTFFRGYDWAVAIQKTAGTNSRQTHLKDGYVLMCK